MLTRRSFIRRTGLAVGATLLAGPRVLAQTIGATEEVVLMHTGAGFGTYVYLPFDVPHGVNRIDVAVTKVGDAKTGAGLFDQRGAGYQSAGFRGIYGEERNAFFVSASEASQSFIPGTIEPGTWTVIVPVFTATTPYTITATVRLTYGPQQAPFVLGPEVGTVRDEAGWYRGDLHCHTPESSDAWKSEKAFTPREWADECRRIGLDYASLTDHNVVSQNFGLADAAGVGVLLLPGEEMTNWFHGHATVSGIEVGDWLDWRQRPGELDLQPNEGRIREFMAIANDMGAYVAVAHPAFVNLAWQFFGDAEVDERSRTHGVEVWTGNFQPDDEAALLLWDSMLVRGQRVVANGGSDLHSRDDTTFKYRAGTPTTVVYASSLSKRAIVDALKAGRSFITRLPDGVEIYLTARGPSVQRTFVGGTIYGEPSDTAQVEVLVRKGGGMRLILWSNGALISTTQLDADEQSVSATVPIGAGGYVRAEVRSAPHIDSTAPVSSSTDMEAFTNPIFLVLGEPPPGTSPEDAPPPSTTPPPPDRPPPTLPATGGSSAVVPAIGVAAAAVAMTLTELRWRASLAPDTVAGLGLRLVGLVTGPGVLTRWVPARCGCDDHEAAVEVGLRGDLPEVGTWVEVEGTWAVPSDDPPVVDVAEWRPIDPPISRLEV